jgi:N6-adenosine-specific RNA methylase IME4
MAAWQFGALAMFGYDVIVADPPWDFENYSDAGTKKGADPHYSVMPLKAIKALPVHELARGDCLLLLWTTGWAIATGQALEVARAWGFKPISEIVWLKRYPSGKARIGTGYRVRTRHEPILVCTIGNPQHKPFPSTFDGIAREHSRKPDEFSRAEPYAAGNPARRSIQPADTSWVRRVGK